MSTPPFPSLPAMQRAAALGLGLGTLSMTATFGLRTVIFQPGYGPAADQMATLAIHGAVEAAVAVAIGFLVLRPSREGLSKALLVALAVLITGIKGFYLMALVAIGEPDPWAFSPLTWALCALVQIPLWFTFLPVVTAVFAARGARASATSGLPAGTLASTPAPRDSPLEVRAALCVWLATVGLGTVLLGPDWLVRLWGSIVLGAAAAHLGIGLAEERRLLRWAREAVTQGPPAFAVQDQPPPAEVPALFADDERRATLSAISEQAGSYRSEPAKEPLAAIDPANLRRERSFGKRVTRRLAAPVVYTLLAVAVSWPLLHTSEIPPREIASRYHHQRILPYEQHKIEGVTLWAILDGEHGERIIGWDVAAHAVVEGEALFRRVRGVSMYDLSDLANSMIYGGADRVVHDTDLRDEAGRPQVPFIKDGTLVFWRRGYGSGKAVRSEAPYEEGMIDAAKDKQSPSLKD